MLGAFVVPFMNKDFYKKILLFMVSLAVGVLGGSGLFHLLPHVSLTPIWMKILLPCCVGLPILLFNENQPRLMAHGRIFSLQFIWTYACSTYWCVASSSLCTREYVAEQIRTTEIMQRNMVTVCCGLKTVILNYCLRSPPHGKSKYSCPPHSLEIGTISVKIFYAYLLLRAMRVHFSIASPQRSAQNAGLRLNYFDIGLHIVYWFVTFFWLVIQLSIYLIG